MTFRIFECESEALTYSLPEKCLNLTFFWSEYRKIWTRKNSVFGHFSRSNKVGKYSADKCRYFSYAKNGVLVFVKMIS